MILAKIQSLIQNYYNEHKYSAPIYASVLSQLWYLGAIESGQHFPELCNVGGEGGVISSLQQVTFLPIAKK